MLLITSVFAGVPLTDNSLCLRLIRNAGIYAQHAPCCRCLQIEVALRFCHFQCCCRLLSPCNVSQTTAESCMSCKQIP